MTADVVVVGSGAGGAATAWRLTSQGAKVLLLEAGPAFEPAVDYPHTEMDWEKKGFPSQPLARSLVSYGDLGMLDPEYEDLKSWSRVRSQSDPLPGTARGAGRNGYSHVMGVGGTTLHFVGEAHRLHPDAFRLKTLTGKGADWPMPYETLEPYYTICEEQIGVAGADVDDPRWRSAPYPMPAHPLSPGAKWLERAGASAGQIWLPNPRAANSRPYDDRPSCNYCGLCNRGCPLGDKGSADVTYLRKAMATGHLTLWPDSRVTRLVLGKDGRISHLEVVQEGRLQRVETPILVLSAGAVHTPRLLLGSASAELPDGLANSAGQVGRNFMETLYWSSAGLAPGLRNSHMGLPADAAWSARGAPASTPGHAGGYRLTHATLDIGLNGPLSYASRMVAGFGEGYKSKLREVFGSAIAVSAIGQVISDDRSRVDLDPQKTDDLGLPVARISSVLTTDSLNLLREMARSTRAVLQAGGVDVIEETSAWSSFLSTHVFGTARMGVNAAESVVDSVGRSHDHSNLWIADASVFPTSGSGEAPSLTIMALAVRTADHIVG